MNATHILHAADDPGAGQFLGVDWGSFVAVLLVALAATVVIVCFYALALRLLSLGAPLDGSDERSTAPATAATFHRPPLATVAAVVCIAICVAAVLYGIWLVIPQFH
ncbi:hypothetical protein ACI2IX_13470 [Leifsonia aquatica]|uniref:hypothetical protein n=1 Tax=Leifsonia aquatica TaxID=144185 RepID=UPI00384DF3DD